ncbi:MAG TPA: rRNA maturation RNase YbeY [Acidobacteriota bacterium]
MKKKVRARNQINVFNNQRRHRVSTAAIRRFASSAATALGVADREMTVQFVGARKMAQLNWEFRGTRYATDVLSFSGWDAPELATYLGDIVICPEAARKNSSHLARELRILVLHGMLHLVGYDHEADDGEMDRLEQRLRRRLGLQ